MLLSPGPEPVGAPARRGRRPIPPIPGLAPLAALVCLEELPGSLGLVLFRSAADVALWSECEPPHRRGLFRPGEPETAVTDDRESDSFGATHVMDLHNNDIGRTHRYEQFRNHWFHDRWDWKEWATRVRDYMNYPAGNGVYIPEWKAGPTTEQAGSVKRRCRMLATSTSGLEQDDEISIDWNARGVPGGRAGRRDLRL